MLRVLRWNVGDNFNWFKTLWRHEFHSVIRYYGVEFVTEYPDLILCCNFPPPHEFCDVPAVVEITRDGTSMPAEHLAWVAAPNVVAVFRNAMYRYPEFYSRPMVLDDYYGYVWARETGRLAEVRVQTPPPLPERIRDITRLALPLYIPPSDGAFQLTANSPPISRRPYDVGFSGRMFYDNNWPQLHRQMLADLFPDLPGRNSWAGFWGRDDAGDYLGYFRWMLGCKIILSPWGYAGWNARDYEAILAGCILVKPECSGLTAIPDLYDPMHRACTFCKVDFSDLGDVIQNILDDLPRRQRAAEEARRWLVKHLHANALLRVWCEALCTAVRSQ